MFGAVAIIIHPATYGNVAIIKVFTLPIDSIIKPANILATGIIKTTMLATKDVIASVTPSNSLSALSSWGTNEAEYAKVIPTIK